jgi:hypothetical protein
MRRALFRKSERKRALGRLKHTWRIILEWILEKYVMNAWTGFIWIRKGSIGRVLLNMVMNFFFP